MQLVALGDKDLALDQIDAGDDFGDRVLDLDARVDLDEEEFAAIHVEQKLDRPGVVVIGRLAKAHRGVADRAFAGPAAD